jgi:hypothetical protein
MSIALQDSNLPRDPSGMKYSVHRRSEVQGVVLMQDGGWTTLGFAADPPLGKTLIRRFTEQMVSKSDDGEPTIMVKGPALYRIGQELNVTFKRMHH